MKRCVAILLCVGCVSLSALAQPIHDLAQQAAAEPALRVSGHVPNFAHPAESLYTGGQPDAEAWGQLMEAGVTTVINLRSAEEMQGSDEEATVRALGMQYVSIPVAGAADVDVAHAERLHEALAAASGAVLVHCASGNRVGALLAIDAAQAKNMDVEQAVEHGRSAGLTSLESRVREVLAAPQPSD